MLAKVFGSKTKTKIIKHLYLDVNRRFFMRQIEREVGEQINSVREALLFLVKAGLVSSEKVGRKLYFSANKDGLFYDEILRMVTKSEGLGGVIIKEKLRLGKIKTVFFTNNFFNRHPNPNGEIDIFIIGEVSPAEISKLIKDEEQRIGREINYSIMTREEFSFRKKNKDPFLVNILQKGRLLLLGKESYLEES